MEAVVEGRLSGRSGAREALQEVLRQAPDATGLFRISACGEDLSGKLAVVKGRYIIGAQVAGGSLTGYPAVRKLLAVTEGNFAFLQAAAPLPPDMDQSLHISLPALIDRLPDLPESAGDLFDEKSLLDEVFSPTAEPAAAASAHEALVPPSAPAVPPATPAPPAWNVLNPLIDDWPAVAGGTPLLSPAARARRQSTTDGDLPLQQAPDGPASRPRLPIALLLLALLAIALAIGPLIMTVAHRHAPP